MHLTIDREFFLKPLQAVGAVVESRQTKQILSNILFEINQDQLIMTSTDEEIEMRVFLSLEEDLGQFKFTLPGKKLVDICRSLPEGVMIDIESNESGILIKSGRSKFKLASLNPDEFPDVRSVESEVEFKVQPQIFRSLMEKTAFSMAQSDVRFYLNGMLLEVSQGQLRTVATDGHRFSMSTTSLNYTNDEVYQSIIPRKGIHELSKILVHQERDILVKLSQNHISVQNEEFCFTSKLVDSRFPDYTRVIPKHYVSNVTVDRIALRDALTRASILTNEKLRSVRLIIESNTLSIAAINQQEQADDEVAVVFDGEPLDFGFNVVYLLDALNALDNENITFSIAETNHSLAFNESGKPDVFCVVMPLVV